MKHRVLVELIVDDWSGSVDETLADMCSDWRACIVGCEIISQVELGDSDEQ